MNQELINSLSVLQSEMKEWMSALHQHPELAMEEHWTSQYIASKLEEWGYDVAKGVGGTGIVASMTVGNGTKSIGLRADFDAVPIAEDNNLPYKSQKRRHSPSLWTRFTLYHVVGSG